LQYQNDDLAKERKKEDTQKIDKKGERTEDQQLKPAI